MMSTEDVVMIIDKPHFTVKLHKTLLEVDLKKGVKKALEDVLEAKPIIRESLGFLFQTIVPLDVPLKNIESANVDGRGQVKITIPSRKDIVIPLEPNESRRLVEKMNEFIPLEKERALLELQRTMKIRAVFASRIAETEAETYRRKK